MAVMASGLEAVGHAHDIETETRTGGLASAPAAVAKGFALRGSKHGKHGQEQDKEPLCIGPVFAEARSILGEFCMQVVNGVRDCAAPSIGASSATLQPMSGQSMVSSSSMEEAGMSAEVLHDLNLVASFARANMPDIKVEIECTCARDICMYACMYV